MIVHKVRGEDKVNIYITRSEHELALKLGLTLNQYISKYLWLLAKKRRWKWYLNREKTK